MPGVSVVLPVFNGASYIREAIESVLDQSVGDFELVVLDNCSTDATPRIVSEFLHDDRVSFHRADAHVPMPVNFARALRMASAPIVRFLSCDDVLHKDCLMMSRRILDSSSSIGLVTSDHWILDSRGEVVGRRKLGTTGKLSASIAATSIVQKGNWIGGPSGVTLRVSALPDPPFSPKFECAFDVDTWLRMTKGSDIYVEGEALYSVRVHPEQATNKCWPRGFHQDWSQVLSVVGAHDPAYPEVPVSTLRAARFRHQMRGVLRSLIGTKFVAKRRSMPS